MAKLADVLKFIENCPEFPATFLLRYKDDEGDLLLIQSEKEFSEAAQQCQKQKVLQIECIEVPATDPCCLKKGAPLPSEDDPEPFQIIQPDEKSAEGPEPGQAVQPEKPADKPAVAVNNANPAPKPDNTFINAMDKKATPAPVTNTKADTVVGTEVPPLVLLDALLANVSGSVGEHLKDRFRMTRAAFIQELAAIKSQQLDQDAKNHKAAEAKTAKEAVVEAQKPKDGKEKQDKEKEAPAKVPAEPQEKDKPAAAVEKKEVAQAKEEKRGSKTDIKPKLDRPNSKFQKQLDELDSMGFSDGARNEALLNKYNGNVSKAINVLIHT
jgi:hypothetical protein